MDDPNHQLRVQAIWALRPLGERATPLLTRFLRGSFGFLDGKAALEVLAAVDPSHRAAESAIGAMLKDHDVEVRRNATFIMREQGPECRWAIPALERAMKERDIIVPFGAAVAIRKIDPEHAAAMDFLIRTIKSKDRGGNPFSIIFLGILGENARPAVPALEGAFEG